jgi:CHAT domain-containing protein/predicted negative regulator of RcsB-dependent stress response
MSIYLSVQHHYRRCPTRIRLAGLYCALSFLALIILSARLLTVVAAAKSAQANTVAPSQSAQSGSEKGEARKVFEEAEALRNQNTPESYRRAVEKYEAAVRLYRAEGNKAQEALSLMRAAPLFSNLGERQKALNYCEQALRLFRQIGDRQSEAGTLDYLAKLHFSADKRKDALAYWKSALPLFQALKDAHGEAGVLYHIGLCNFYLGDKNTAVEYYDRALLVFREARDRAWEAFVLQNLGRSYRDLGEMQKALEAHSQALALFREVKIPDEEAAALSNMGLVYNFVGERRKALDHFSQARAIFQSLGQKRDEAIVIQNQGLVYDNLGERQAARDHYDQALSILLKEGDRRAAAATLINLGAVHESLGEKQKALDAYAQALQFASEVGDRQRVIYALNSLSAVRIGLNNTDKALEDLNRALSLTDQVGDPRAKAGTLDLLGRAWVARGEAEKAVEYFRQALPLRRRAGDLQGEIRTNNSLMAVYKDSNKSLAVWWGKQSVNGLQQLRSGIRSFDQAVQKSYLRAVSETYVALADLLISQGRLSEAHQVMRLYKDQELLDAPGASQAQPVESTLRLTQQETDAGALLKPLLVKVGALGQQYADLKRRIGQGTPTAEEEAELKRLGSEQDAASEQMQAALRQMPGMLSESAIAQNRAEPTEDTAGLQEALRQLSVTTGTNAAAIYSLTAQNNFRLLLITKSGITAVSSPVKAADVNQKAQKLLRIMQSPSLDPRPLAQEIYEFVLRPIEPELEKHDIRTLMWALDGSLRYLPMAALWDGRQYLIERYNTVSFTRASKERMVAAVSPHWTGTGFGSTKGHTLRVADEQLNFKPLNGVTEELDGIFGRRRSHAEGVVSGQVLADEQFTKPAFFAALKQRTPLVHIASHFRFWPGDERKTFLLLGNGETLSLAEMKDIPDLFGGVELLTLSACSTGAELPDANGREIDGFAELAQRKGAGAVIASLWEVADLSTAQLMAEMYRQRQQGKGITKAAALRQAQLALLRGRTKASSTVLRRSELVGEIKGGGPVFKRDPKAPYAHPYYWAPFILIGNWR